jgi:hypothetical protein
MSENNNQLDLSNYKERLEKGHLSWSNENGVAVLTQKTFDSAHNEIGFIKTPFSTQQLGKIRNDMDRQILDRRDQILALEEQISNIEKQKTDLYDVIEADVVKTEKKAEPKK